jgi:hypothetical protein
MGTLLRRGEMGASGIFSIVQLLKKSKGHTDPQESVTYAVGFVEKMTSFYSENKKSGKGW